MKECIINFPGEIRVDIYNPPEDFGDQIKRAFSEYTKGTNKDFIYVDKLSFIDRIVSMLHKADSWLAVKDMLMSDFEYEIEEGDRLPNPDNYNCIEFMRRCYEKGIEDHSLYYNFPDNDGLRDHHVYERIGKLEYRAIKAVIEWES